MEPIAEILKPNRTAEIIQSMVSRMIWLQMNEQTGQVLTDKCVTVGGLASLFSQNQTDFSADLRTYNALTTEWSENGGWFSPQGTASALGEGDGAGGAAARINAAGESDALHAFFNLDTLDGIGGMLFMFDFKTSANVSATEYVFNYGSWLASHTYGGFGFSIFNGPKVGATMFDKDNSEAAIGNATGNALATDGTRYKIGGYFDAVNDTVSTYAFANDENLNQSDSDAGPGTGNWPTESRTTVAASLPDYMGGHANNSGLGILSAAGSTPNNPMGSNAAANEGVRNLQWIRFEYDASGIWQQLIEDAYNNPFELSENFRGI